MPRIAVILPAAGQSTRFGNKEKKVFAALDGRVGAFTDVVADRALAKADAVDRAGPVAAGPLAGAPFAVKNLFDLAGVTTRAGSAINRDNHADFCRIPAWCYLGTLYEYVGPYTGRQLQPRVRYSQWRNKRIGGSCLTRRYCLGRVLP